MSKVYTKTGDSGETSLFGGTRVSKDHVRIEAYGQVDELNSHLGIVISLFQESKLAASDLQETIDLLFKIQSQLFNFGGQLATEDMALFSKYKLELDKAVIAMIEKDIDKMTAILPTLKTFILPSGSLGAGQIHVARAVCRRAERAVISFLGTIDKAIFPDKGPILLNRLSDYLFTLARYYNFLYKITEIPWHP